MEIDPAERSILRAKYLDWCSAQVAERFVELTPDQIYDLAHRLDNASEDDAGVGRSASEPSPEAGAREGGSASKAILAGIPQHRRAVGVPMVAGLSFRALVARVAEALAGELALPTFEEWVDAYRSDPERYEAELLGLWQRGV